MTKQKKPSTHKPWDLDYFPYFTELCLIHGWPHPDWLPGEWGRDDVAQSQRSSAAREVQVAAGRPGTMVGLSDKSDLRAKNTRAPGWMK